MPVETTQVYFGFHNLHQGLVRSLEVTAFFPITFLHKIDTAVRVVSLCSARQNASNDMFFICFGGTWPWGHVTWRGFDILSLSKIRFRVSRRDEHDGVRIIAISLSVITITP